MFSINCQRLQLCSYEVSEISKNVVWMPDQSIYGDREYRWGQIGTLCSEEWSFSVHLWYTSEKPALNLAFLGFIGSKRNKISGKKVQIKRKTSKNITQIR